MNDKFYNNKFTISSPFKTSFFVSSPVFKKDNTDVYMGDWKSCATKIKKYELEKDEVYSGNLFIGKKYKSINFEKIFQYDISDNVIYINRFTQTPYPHECNIVYDLIYCNSFVFWILSQDNNKLYNACRVHRIKLRKINGGFYE